MSFMKHAIGRTSASVNSSTFTELVDGADLSADQNYTRIFLATSDTGVFQVSFDEGATFFYVAVNVAGREIVLPNEFKLKKGTSINIKGSVSPANFYVGLI